MDPSTLNPPTRRLCPFTDTWYFWNARKRSPSMNSHTLRFLVCRAVTLTGFLWKFPRDTSSRLWMMPPKRLLARLGLEIPFRLWKLQLWFPKSFEWDSTGWTNARNSRSPMWCWNMHYPYNLVAQLRWGVGWCWWLIVVGFVYSNIIIFYNPNYSSAFNLPTSLGWFPYPPFPGLLIAFEWCLSQDCFC